MIPQILKQTDPQLASLLELEEKRQENTLSLIPSENHTHPAVIAALGSVCTNKYSEGYPGRRYYNGNEFIDQIENLARERTKQLFRAKFANVQAYSGSPANLAVYFALLEPGDNVMGLELSHGGHLTHGAKVSFSGKWFNQLSIKVGADYIIDYDELEKAALEFKPKMIIAGITAYPLEINYKRLSQIARACGAYLVADISHTNGFVIAGLHAHPLEMGADVVMTTTHKLLRGPRGAVIVTNDEVIAKKIDKAIMPGLQGGPHNHQTAAIAVAMEQAMQPEYKEYVKQVAKNAQAMAKVLSAEGIELVAGRTQNHLMLLDLRPLNISGKEAADLLESAGLVVNPNSIPNDPAPPLKPSGIRVGTPAITTRGLGEKESGRVAELIAGLIKGSISVETAKSEVANLCKDHPVYPV
jgi:glycine hydroxymethyltransferase